MGGNATHTLTEDEVPIGTLSPYARNARTHDARNLAAIRASLERFGQVERLVVWGETGIVLGGNGRLAVLKAMGVERVRISRVELSDAEAEALNVALNRTGELAGWNDAQLAANIEAVLAGDIPIDALGFTEAELAALTGAPPVWTDPPSRVAEAEALRDAWAVEAGQRWVIPSLKGAPAHVLVVGDAADPATVQRAVGGLRCGVLLTDPPYGVGLIAKGSILRKKGVGPDGRKRFNLYSKRWTGRAIQGDQDAEAGDVMEVWRAVLAAAEEHALTPDAAHYIWYPSARTRDVFNLLCGDLAIRFHAGIVWAKDRFVLSRLDYHYRHEMCFYGWRKRPPWLGPRNIGTVWEEPSHHAGGHHPAEKPLALFVPPVRNHLARGGAVYDPFLGSGTALLAAEACGRTGIGIELDPLWAAVALQRLKDAGLSPGRDG